LSVKERKARLQTKCFVSVLNGFRSNIMVAVWKYFGFKVTFFCCGQYLVSWRLSNWTRLGFLMKHRLFKCGQMLQQLCTTI